MPTEKPVQEKQELQKVNQENSTIVKNEFLPSRLMRAWLAKSFELGYSASITEIAETIKADPSNWYKWLDKDGFVEWWDSQWQKEIKRTRWKLDSIGIKKSEKSYRFWKDMMNRTGNTIPEAGTIGNQVNQQFNIPYATMERLDK